MVGEVLVLLLFGHSLRERTLLFMDALMCYRTTNQFHKLTRLGSCRLFKNSNKIFMQLIVSPIPHQNHLHLSLLIIFPPTNLIFPHLLLNLNIDPAISHSSLAFTNVAIASTSSVAVSKLTMKRGIMLRRRT